MMMVLHLTTMVELWTVETTSNLGVSIGVGQTGGRQEMQRGKVWLLRCLSQLVQGNHG